MNTWQKIFFAPHYVKHHALFKENIMFTIFILNLLNYVSYLPLMCLHSTSNNAIPLWKTSRLHVIHSLAIHSWLLRIVKTIYRMWYSTTTGACWCRQIQRGKQLKWITVSYTCTLQQLNKITSQQRNSVNLLIYWSSVTVLESTGVHLAYIGLLTDKNQSVQTFGWLHRQFVGYTAHAPWKTDTVCKLLGM